MDRLGKIINVGDRVIVADNDCLQEGIVMYKWKENEYRIRLNEKTYITRNSSEIVKI